MHCSRIHLGQHPVFLICLVLVMPPATGRVGRMSPSDTGGLCQIFVMHKSEKLFGCCYRNSPPLVHCNQQLLSCSVMETSERGLVWNHRGVGKTVGSSWALGHSLKWGRGAKQKGTEEVPASSACSAVEVLGAESGS